MLVFYIKAEVCGRSKGDLERKKLIGIIDRKVRKHAI